MGSASEGVPFEVSATAYPQHWEEEELGQSAYERTLPEMAAIPAAKIMTVNLNLTEVIATGLGVVPQVRALATAWQSRAPTVASTGSTVSRIRSCA